MPRGALLSAAVLLFVCAHAQDAIGSVTLVGGTFSYVPGVKVAGAVATGSLTQMNASVNGFADLSIATSKSFSDADQMFAAGMLEGALTQAQIYLHSININAWIEGNFGGKPPPQKYADFFAAQDAWTRAQVAANASLRWVGMGLLLRQFDGLRAGYAAAAPADAPVSEYLFQQMNAIGDLLDLIPALEPGSAHAAPWAWEAQTSEEIVSRARKINHCSGLFRVTGDLSDIFWGHSAWFTYMGTNRIMKHYSFAVQAPGLLGTQMSFSSYPAYLSSLDDFYVTWSTKMIMVETTNGIYNMSLYKLVRRRAMAAGSSLDSTRRPLAGAAPPDLRCSLCSLHDRSSRRASGRGSACASPTCSRPTGRRGATSWPGRTRGPTTMPTACWISSSLRPARRCRPTR